MRGKPITTETAFPCGCARSLANTYRDSAGTARCLFHTRAKARERSQAKARERRARASGIDASALLEAWR